MNKIWFKGIEPDYVSEIRGDYASSFITRKRLTQILEDKKESNMKGCLSKDNYDSPNWAMIQADNIGYQRALEEIIKLLE